jgi:glutathione-independent formaldehyde dehydrogenase
MGGWVGGQAEYVLVPYADWNLLKFPDKDQALEKILDLAMLSDIFPSGFHGCVTAGVGPSSTVYVAGAGPVGLAAATSAQLLGAAVVIVGDLNADRLAQAATFVCETVDISKGDPKDQIEQILGVPEVDAAVDAVGFDARGHGDEAATERPEPVLNTMMDITAPPGGSVSRVCTSLVIRVPSTSRPKKDRCPYPSDSAGPSRLPSSPANAQSCATTGS